MDSNHRYPEREACFFPGRNSLAGTASRRGRASVSGLWKEGAGSGFGEVAGAGRLDQASGSSLRRRSGAGLGDYSRRRSLLGLVRPDRDRQARRSYARAGQRNVSRGGGGAHSSGWEPRSAPARGRYKLTPKSCPTRAGRLKAATPRAMPSTPEGRARAGVPTVIRPGSATGRTRMRARVGDRGSIRHHRRPRNRGTRSSRRLPTPRR